ncbi:MAG: DUF664 domain-containing protein [Ornithinimicrobium sp.]
MPSRHYLQQSRDSLLCALEGLNEFDARRPVMPSGTNLLGLVEHLPGVEASPLGDCVGRPAPFRLRWVEDDSIWDSADMWATADESHGYIVGLYRGLGASRRFNRSPAPRLPAVVTSWPEERGAATFGHLLVRVVAEAAQHAEHADIIRETLDGRGGRDHDDIGGTQWWDTYVRAISGGRQPVLLNTRTRHLGRVPAPEAVLLGPALPKDPETDEENRQPEVQNAPTVSGARDVWSAAASTLARSAMASASAGAPGENGSSSRSLFLSR